MGYSISRNLLGGREVIKMKFYRFKALYWDSCEEKEMEESGFICAETYADAADKIERWFKNELIAITYLYEMEERGEEFLLDFDIDDARKGLR